MENKELVATHGVAMVEQLLEEVDDGWRVVSVNGILASTVLRKLCSDDLPPAFEDALVARYSQPSAYKACDYLLLEPEMISQRLILRLVREAPPVMHYLVTRSEGKAIPRDVTLPAACYYPWDTSSEHVKSFLIEASDKSGFLLDELMVLLPTWRGTLQEALGAVTLTNR